MGPFFRRLAADDGSDACGPSLATVAARLDRHTVTGMRLSERALVGDRDIAGTYAVDSSLGATAPESFTVVRARDVGDVVEVLRHAAA